MADVDNRIVGLQFDNARFESGVKQSIKSLEELNKGLELKDAGKGFSEVQRAADSLNLSKIATAVDQISDRFSTLGIIGMRVLTNLADSAMNFGRRMGDFMVTGPAQQGYNEYEKLMNITKVLINTFPGQMDVIKATLKDMNMFADETIYSFGDMTDNITKFTNAGMGVAESGQALKGVATWAALSGASTQQAAQAMYNVGQAFQAGKMMAVDWRSVSNANMASMEFKLYALKKATEMGVIKPGQFAADTWADFMKKGKFTADVLGAVLKDYGNPMTEIGARALLAAKEVTTLTQVVGIMKETLGTGWAEVWEQIFGSYDEAKSLFTGLADFFGNIIRESHKARMEVIGKWREEGGRTNLLLGLSSSLVAFRNILGTVKEAFSNVFGNTTYNILTALSTGFANFGVNLVKWLGDPLADGSTRLEKFGNILEVIFKAFRVIGDVVGFAWQAIKLFLGSINISKIASGFLDWLISTGNAIAKFGADAIATYGPKIVAWFGSLGEAIAPVFGWIASVGNTVISFFSTLWNSFAGSEKVQGAWADIKKFFTDIPLKITEFIASFEGKSLGDILKGWVEGFIAGIPGAIQKVKDAIVGFWETLFPKKSGMYDGMPDGARAIASANPMMMMSDGFTKDTSFLGIIKSTIDGWKKTISGWFSSLWENLVSNETISKAWDDISSWFTSLFRGDKINGFMVSSTGEVTEIVGYLPGKIENALIYLWGEIKKIPGALLQLGLSLIAGLPGVLQSIGGFFSGIWESLNVKEKFKNITDGLGEWITKNVPKPILDAFSAIGNFIAPVVESVKAFFGKIWTTIQDIFNPKTGIEKIDSMSFLDKLKGVFKNKGGVEAYFKEAWGNIKSTFDKIKASFSKKIGSLGDQLKAIFSGAKKSLTEKPGEQATSLFDGVGDVLASLGGGLSKLWDWLMGFSNQFTLAGAATFGTVIFVILAIAKFFHDIGSAAKNMAKAAFRTKVNFWNTTAGQFIAIAGAVTIMAGVMYAIGKIGIGEFTTGALVIAGILGVLGGVMWLLTQLKVNSTIGISFLAMAGSVILVLIAVKSMVKILKGIDGTNWLSYTIALVAVGGIMWYMSWLLKRMGNTSFTGTVDWKSIIALAAAMWIILQTLKPIANYKFEQLVNMGVVLAALTTALVVLMNTSKPMEGFKPPNWKPILAAAAGIWLVGISLRQFSKMKGWELPNALVALAAITIALRLLMDASTNKRGGLLVGTAPDWKAMLAAAAGIWLVAEALLPFANMTPEQLGRMALALIGITAALAALVAIQKLKTSMPGAISMAVAALGAMGIIWALGEALSKVKDVNTATIEAFIDGLAVIFAAMIGQEIIGALNNAGWAGALTTAISSGGAIYIIQSLAEGLLKVKHVDTDKIEAFTQGVSRILWGVAGLSGVALLATVAGVPLGTAITALGVIITGLAALDLIPGFAEFVSGAGDVLGQIAGAFEGAYSVAKFKRISDSIVSIAGVDLDKTKTDAILTFMQDLSDFMTGAGGKSTDIDNGQSAADKAISTLTGTKLLEALTSLGESLPPIVEALGPTFNSEKFGADTAAIITFMGSLATFMSDLTDQNVEIERYTSGFEQFIGVESGPFQMVMQGLTDIGTRLGTFAASIQGIGTSNFRQELINAIAAIASVKNFMIEVQGLGEINNANFNQVTDGLDTLGHDIAQFTTNVGDTDVKRFTEFAAGIKDLFSGLSIISDISAGVAGSGATLTQAVTDVVSALAITIDPAAIKMSLEAIGNHITRTIGDGMLNEMAVSSIVDKMNTLLSNFGDGGSYDRATSEAIFIELAKWFIARFAEGITESSGVVEEAVSSMTSMVGRLSRSTSVWDSMFNTGAWYARGLAMGLRSEMDAVIDAANALGNAIANSTDGSLEVSSPSKKGVKTGQYYGDGLVIGMTNRVREIRKAATGIGSTALEAVNTKLGIHSPSWEAMKQAAQYVKGFAVGLQKNTKGKTSILSKGLNWLGKQVATGSQVVIDQASKVLRQEKKTGKIISVQDMLRDNIAKIKADRLRADVGAVMNGALSALGVDVEALSKNPLYAEMMTTFDALLNGDLSDVLSGNGANAPGGSGGGGGGGGGGRGGSGGGSGGSSAGRVADVVANDMSRKDMMLNLEQQFDKIAQKLDMLGGMSVVLDDNTLVGKMLPAIDQGLGRSITLEGRM